MTIIMQIGAENPHSRYLKRRRRELRLGVAALLIIAVAWVFGYLNTHSEIAPLVKNVVPGTERVVELDGIYIAYDSDSSTPIGYASVGQAAGYGGPVRMLVGVDTQGAIIGVQVIEQRETLGFFKWLRIDKFLDQFLGTQSSDSLSLGEGIDAVSGATLSSEGVALAIDQAAHTLRSVQEAAPVSIKFGLPEIVLIALFATGFITSRSHNSRFKRWGRTGMMAIGAIVLGFVFSKPLTLAHFTTLLSGYLPDWRTNLYWYLLLGGVVLATFVRGKNPYCSWFCPFGAVQECLGVISGVQVYRPQRFYARFKLLQRGLAFTAIVLGLAFRQPTATSYEPFETLFSLNGGFFPWMFLVIILFSSMIIRRPFCNYLCPIDPIIDFIGQARSWILSLWSLKNQPSKDAPFRRS